LLKHKGRRIEIALPDGDRLVGFVQPGEKKTMVYILHGLAGSIDSAYMHRTAMLAARHGFGTFLVNHRGCGEGAGLARGPYHSGRAEDLSAVIAEGRKLFPDHRHLAIGFSMSGNVLLLLLSGLRGSSQPDCAIAVNAPIHLESASSLLSKGFNRVYDARFYLQCRRDVFTGAGNEELKARLPRFSTIYNFDRLYTAPAGGFRDRQDYYESCSTHHLLDRIKVPTVILSSYDDPFVPVQNYLNSKPSRSVHLHIEKVGGHMGYWNRVKTPLGTRRWQDYAVNEAMKFLIR
jgi:predicted alpha/beta-fold hydrolase